MSYEDAQSTLNRSGGFNLASMAAKKLSNYDGRPDLLVFRDWKEKLEQFFILARVLNDTDKITLGKMQLMGRAIVWSSGVHEISWHSFVAALYKECIPADLRTIQIAKLRKTKQRTSALEYRRLFDDVMAGLEITDDEVKKIFIEGLKHPLKNFLTAQLAILPKE